ncbi:hypothetical protein ACTXT7_007829 [Hymenolepis weldensis]
MAFLDFEDDGELEGEDGAFKDNIIEPVYHQKSDKFNANSSQGRAPTLTIEVIRVSRPLKSNRSRLIVEKQNDII